MKRILTTLTAITFFSVSPLAGQSFGDYPPFTDWYENPLGFYPLHLHAGNAFYLSLIASTACLLLTDRDSTLTDRFTSFNESGVSHGYFPPYTSVFQNNTGFLFHARRWMALGAEFHLYHFRDGFNDTWGAGLRPFVRWYPVSGDDFRLFFEAGAGIIAIADKFPQPTTGYGPFSEPRTGTHVNGTPKYGIGTEINIDRSFSITAAVRHVHVSNGNTWGAENNPGHDSNGLFLGFNYKPIHDRAGQDSD